MKKVIQTPDAPAAIGPYSQAIQAGNLLFVSGQIPLNPKTGELISGSITEETGRVMKNIAAILKAAGADMNNIVKTSIFLKSMGDYAVVNEVYGSYFDQDPPAREAVEVARLPKDVNVEISVIAVL